LFSKGDELYAGTETQNHFVETHEYLGGAKLLMAMIYLNF